MIYCIQHTFGYNGAVRISVHSTYLTTCFRRQCDIITMKTEAIEQYRAALRSGQRYYQNAVGHGKYPYPQVLENVCPEYMSAARQELGILEIPMDSIVGTLADGRKAAFAGNFMPLLPDNTEFSAKWIALCNAHLGTTGITDPISCFEYLGRFYVQEGHKRVSVLHSYGAPTITGKVTRIIPTWSENPAVVAYYEFLEFYKRSGVYVLQFTHPGCIAKIEKLMGFEKGHVWTDEEKSEFMSMFWVMREACTKEMLSHVQDQSLSEVVLSAMELYPYDQLAKLGISDMRKRLAPLIPDLQFVSDEEPSEPTVSTEPAIPEKNLVSRIFDGISRSTLNIAFIHVNQPETSVWTRGHDEGRKYLEEVLGDQISVKTYIVGEESAEKLMERAVTQDGAQLLIATAPTLLGAARQTAALHPGLKVLVCALSVPYVGVRTYYSRIYEAKFISGAIAGAMCGKHPIGYIARYPILGVPASINAFALGVRMTNPNAKIQLQWSCLDGDPYKQFLQTGARIISGHPIAVASPGNVSLSWSTSLMLDDGRMMPLASDVWNWGRTYEQMVRSVLAGAWDTTVPRGTSVSYWWGMSSGVINIELANTLPDGVRQLANILKDGLIRNTVHPFQGTITDQEGNIRVDPETNLTPEDLMQMNWLCENVEGRIPTMDELLPMSRETTELLALPQKETAPVEKRPAFSVSLAL